MLVHGAGDGRERDMQIYVQISRGGVVHAMKHNGVTRCGKSYYGRIDSYPTEATCKSCLKIEAVREPLIEAAIATVQPAVTEPETVAEPTRICPWCRGEADTAALYADGRRGFLCGDAGCLELAIDDGLIFSDVIGGTEIEFEAWCRKLPNTHTPAWDWGASCRAPSWRGKRKGSKVKRQLSHA